MTPNHQKRSSCGTRVRRAVHTLDIAIELSSKGKPHTRMSAAAGKSPMGAQGYTSGTPTAQWGYNRCTPGVRQGYTGRSPSTTMRPRTKTECTVLPAIPELEEEGRKARATRDHIQQGAAGDSRGDMRVLGGQGPGEAGFTRMSPGQCKCTGVAGAQVCRCTVVAGIPGSSPTRRASGLVGGSGRSKKGAAIFFFFSPDLGLPMMRSPTGSVRGSMPRDVRSYSTCPPQAHPTPHHSTSEQSRVEQPLRGPSRWRFETLSGESRLARSALPGCVPAFQICVGIKRKKKGGEVPLTENPPQVQSVVAKQGYASCAHQICGVTRLDLPVLALHVDSGGPPFCSHLHNLPGGDPLAVVHVRQLRIQ